MPNLENGVILKKIYNFSEAQGISVAERYSSDPNVELSFSIYGEKGEAYEMFRGKPFRYQRQRESIVAFRNSSRAADEIAVFEIKKLKELKRDQKQNEASSLSSVDKNVKYSPLLSTISNYAQRALKVFGI